MNGRFTPLPPTDEYKRTCIYIQEGVDVAMRFADKRKQYSNYEYIIRTDYEERESMIAYGTVVNRKVTAYLPASLSDAPATVMSEAACQTMRRLSNPDLPMYGKTALAYFDTDKFKHQRLLAVGKIGDEKSLNRLRQRLYEQKPRAMSDLMRFLNERHPYLVYIMDLFKIRFISLKPEVKHDVAVYPDPYAKIVFYDYEALNPTIRREACLASMYRSCAFITAFDRQNCRLNEKQFLALLDACPEIKSGTALCKELGIRLPTYPCEEIKLLSCTMNLDS